MYVLVFVAVVDGVSGRASETLGGPLKYALMLVALTAVEWRSSVVGVVALLQVGTVGLAPNNQPLAMVLDAFGSLGADTCFSYSINSLYMVYTDRTERSTIYLFEYVYIIWVLNFRKEKLRRTCVVRIRSV